VQSSDAESDNPNERRACWPLVMAEPAGSVDVIFGNTPSSSKPRAALIASVRLAQARYLVRARHHDRVVDCRSRVLAEISAFDQSGHRLPFKGPRGSSRALFESGKMTVLSLT